MSDIQIKYRSIDQLIPYARNSRTHSDAQVAQISASIKEFGFTNPVLIDAEGSIIAGHGRVLAARKLGMASVPCIELGYLTEAQKKAYVIADNKLALNAGWDEEMLRLELADLKNLGYDSDLTGFESDEIASLNPDGNTEDETYSRKIVPPIYEPKGEQPKIVELFDDSKTKELKAEIDQADLPEELANFLHLAAERHTVFDFRNIAEFYAHADKKTQDLMEKSALIIIDFDKAIEYGFVKLSESMAKQYAQDYDK
jgi:hypothetical protein